MKVQRHSPERLLRRPVQLSGGVTVSAELHKGRIMARVETPDEVRWLREPSAFQRISLEELELVPAHPDDIAHWREIIKSYARPSASMFRELDVGQSALLTDIAMCVNYYRLFSPGLYCCINATVQLDDDMRFCPGLIVQVNHGQLKQCDPGQSYDCFKGPPNFVLDVFPGDDLLDYEHRRNCFEGHRVIEYVAVRQTEPVEWIWNRLIDGRFSEIKTKDNELIMSTALPGLWIPSHALKHRDWWAIMGAIARGISRVGHHEFMDTIWKAGKDRTQEEIRQVVHDYQSGRMGNRA